MADFDPDEFLKQNQNQETAPAVNISDFNPDAFLAGAPQGAPVMPSGVDYAVPTAVNTAGKLAAQYAPNSLIKDAYDVAKIVGKNINPAGITEFMQQPVTNALKAGTAYVQGLPWQKLRPNVLGPAIGGAIMSPENILMAPYQMAAYEQEKIRANPRAPGLEYNPYAQYIRGEAPSQKAAGAMNQRMAVKNMPYGAVTPQEQSILDKDRLNMQMRVQAAKRVLGQQQ